MSVSFYPYFLSYVYHIYGVTLNHWQDNPDIGGQKYCDIESKASCTYRTLAILDVRHMKRTMAKGQWVACIIKNLADFCL